MTVLALPVHPELEHVLVRPAHVSTPPSAPHVMHILEAVGGGTSKHLIDVCRAVPARHTVVLTPDRPGELFDPEAAELLRAEGAEVHLIPMRRASVSAVNALAVVKVRSLIRSLAPDVVHGHSSVGGAIARIATLGMNAKAAWTPHGVITNPSALAIQRCLRPATSMAIALSRSEAETLTTLRLATEDTIRIVPNGIDLHLGPPPFDVRAHLGLPAGCRLVMSIARLTPQKAPLDLVATAELLIRQDPHLHVVLIGDGELAGVVDAAIAERGLGRNFHRLRIDKGGSALLPQADAVVLTSIFEGGPYLILEAFRAGVPMVATACVGSVDGIEHRVSGLLAQPGNPASIAQHVTEVLNDTRLAASLVSAGHERLRQLFSMSVMSDNLMAAYSELALQAAAARR